MLRMAGFADIELEVINGVESDAPEYLVAVNEGIGVKVRFRRRRHGLLLGEMQSTFLFRRWCSFFQR